jgi:hypothetical protein
MNVAEAQQEVRSVYLNGSIGQLVSGVIWLVSAALATWGTRREAILLLVFGGMFIFPLTQLVLRLSGKRAGLRPENPLGRLAMQIAFTVPLMLPVVGGAALYNVNWFYPGLMMVVGAHYLPFVFLYGMWQYALLGSVLLAAGLGLGLYLPHAFAPGGWITGILLVLFSMWFGASARRAAGEVAS